MRQRQEIQKVLRRKLIPIGIIAFWLIMMGLLFKNEYDRRQVTPISHVGTVVPMDTWMGIFTKGSDGAESQLGYLRTQSIPQQVDGDVGVEYHLTLKLATQILSFPTEIFLDGTTWISQKNGLQRLAFTVDSFGEHVMKASGQSADGQFKLDIETAGETFPMTVPLRENMMVSGGLGTTSLHIPSLEIGDQVIVPTFDPLTFSYSQYAMIRCVGSDTFNFDGQEIPVKVLETDVNGITSTSWVTFDNEVVYVDTPFGFHLRKVLPHEALDTSKPSGSVDLLNAVAIRPTGLTPFRGATRMRFRLSGLPAVAEPPGDENQVALSKLQYETTAPKFEIAQGATPLADSEFYLTGDAFVQIDHPVITDLRDEIISSDASDLENARAIYEWLWINIEKKPVLSFPSALDVAKTREGDCNEHTVLFTALARAAGIPTRMAIGVVWSSALNGFYYHGWPEIYTDHWIPMDPTLGQPIADATHIKFLEGNVDAWPKLIAYLGQVQIEVLEIE
jgi:hypothetical protein